MRVLIADDDPMIRQFLRVLIEEAGGGHEVVAAAPTPEEALALAADAQPDVVITDLVMGSSDHPPSGYLLDLKRRAPDARVVIFSGHSPVPHPLPAGADQYLLKPATADAILEALAGP